MGALRLYLRYTAFSIRAQMAYPGSFLLLSCGAFLVTVIEFVGVWALFRRFGHLQGWSLGEVSLFYGLVSMIFAFGDAVTRGFDVFGEVFVKTGGFDRLLVRPRTTALQLLGYELRLTRVGRLVQGMLVFAIGVHLTHITFGPAALAILLWAALGGIALFSGLFVFQATMSFWTVESLEVMNVLTYGGEAAAEYPLNIYAGWFRNVLTFVVPIGCVTYFPMLAAMGRADPLGTPAWVLPLTPAAGFAFLAVALWAWGFGVRHYTSTGS
ncbi:ABC transporter permease [Caulobacter sp. KR2-114]|uniref:ABC transporter permease n=1 Tax=Caulobacter sp. KR2-114 TaxID=3400912 RepID=UPI003C11A6E6